MGGARDDYKRIQVDEETHKFAKAIKDLTGERTLNDAMKPVLERELHEVAQEELNFDLDDDDDKGGFGARV